MWSFDSFFSFFVFCFLFSRELKPNTPPNSGYFSCRFWFVSYKNPTFSGASVNFCNNLICCYIGGHLQGQTGLQELSILASETERMLQILTVPSSSDFLYICTRDRHSAKITQWGYKWTDILMTKIPSSPSLQRHNRRCKDCMRVKIRMWSSL